jgi:hypothetical protein
MSDLLNSAAEIAGFILLSSAFLLLLIIAKALMAFFQDL